MKKNGYMFVAVFLCWAITGIAGSRVRENMAKNESFELPPEFVGAMPVGWEMYSSHDMNCDVNEDIVRTGDKSLMLYTHGEKDGVICVYQVLDASIWDQFEFTINVRNSGDDPLKRSAVGVMSIEWIDNNDERIGKRKSVEWDHRLSTKRWERYSIEGKAPRGTVRAHFVIALCDGKDRGRGSFLIDDIEIIRK